MACLLGGVAYQLCASAGLSIEVTALLSSSVVVLVRILAAKYKISLPVLHEDDVADTEK